MTTTIANHHVYAERPQPLLATAANRAVLLGHAPGVRYRTYYVWTRRPGGVELGPDPELPVIVCAIGQLQVGSALISDPDYGASSVSWHQADGNGVSSGHLFFTADGLICHGNIAAGPPGADLAPRDVFASAVPPASYRTRTTTARYPDGTDPATVPDSGWTEGPTLVLGYRLDAGGFPRTVVRIDGQDLADYVGLNVDTNDRLELGLAAGSSAPIICAVDANLPLGELITFALDGNSFAGAVSATCADPSGTGSYLITGTAEVALELPAAVRAEPALAEAVAPGAPAELSLAELISLVPDSTVSDQANALLVQSMKWAFGQTDTGRGWLQDFWLQTPPVVPADQVTLIQQDATWYQKQFGIGYLSYGLNSLSGPAAPATTLDDAQSTKLTSFLSSSMATSVEYNRQNHGLFNDAYAQVKPRLAGYVADGAQWAAQLLGYLGVGAPLSQTTNRIIATSDASAAGNISALLMALDPTGASAQTYAERVVCNLLAKASLQTSVIDEAWTMTWLPDMLKAYADRYAARPSGVRAAATAPAAGDDANPTPQQVAENLQDAADDFGDWVDLAKEMAKCLVYVKGVALMRQGEEAAEAFARRYPKWALASRVMFVVAWAGGLLSVIFAFLDFDKASGTERASAINKTIGLAADAAEAILGLLKPKPTLDDWMELDDFAASERGLGGIGEIARGVGGDEFLEQGATETTYLFQNETRTVVTEGTTWAKVFTGAGKVVAWIGVGVAAVSTVLSFIDFVNDLKKGHVGKAVMDGLLTVANAAVTVALVVGVLLESVAAAIAASVFAIIGLVITIIELFVPAPKEPTPADTFMAKVAVPFVNALPAAAAG